MYASQGNCPYDLPCRLPDAENIFSIYACDAGAANKSWAMGKSLIEDGLLLLPKYIY